MSRARKGSTPPPLKAAGAPPAKVLLWQVRIDDATSLTDTAKRHREHMGKGRGEGVGFVDAGLHCTLWYTGKAAPGAPKGAAGGRAVASGGGDPFAAAYKLPVDLRVHFVLYGRAHVVAAVSFLGAHAAQVGALCCNEFPHVTLWTAPGAKAADSQAAVAEMVRATGPLEEFWSDPARCVDEPVTRKGVGVAVPTPGLVVHGVVDTR